MTDNVIEGTTAEKLPARRNTDLNRRMSRDATRRSKRLYLQSHASLLLIDTEIHPHAARHTPTLSIYDCM